MSNEYWMFYDPATGSDATQKGSGPAGTFAVQAVPSTWIGLLLGYEDWCVSPPPLEATRAALWNWVKDRRDVIVNGGAPSPIGVVQTDDDSRTNLNGAVLMALLAKQAAEPFAISWVGLDNVQHVLDADQVMAVGKAAGLFVAAIHAHSQVLRGAIEGAADLHALLTISVANGWPTTGAA